jgi:hypothetical protein
VRSTQRVEKAHLIKRLDNGKRSLRQLLKDIDSQVKSERQTRAHLMYQREVKVTRRDTQEAHLYFAAIVEENKRYLASYGQYEMPL